MNWSFNPNLVGPWDEVFPPDPTVGYLYVMAFDSGWTKVGLTTNWPKRQQSHKSTFRGLGWALSQEPWKSCVVPRDDLGLIEMRLRAEARRTSDGNAFNPRVAGVGRDRSKPAGTELFRGCSFEYLVAFADVLARTDALV
ncbi:hypothetical protein [Rhodococcus globerulus]|uniref:GIY-YIG nuclease family protein n=1 Tax=Rhodococcus globerulus TaxID=33008 RepID=A0ABU4C3I6_RHOGO|nr:hypothetical protein [Rhodococcus globerulus]MDV6271063.1 hypothetical protein [Rhodococcus globerulus]